MLLWLIAHNHCAQFASSGLGPRKQRAAAGASRYAPNGGSVVGERNE